VATPTTPQKQPAAKYAVSVATGSAASGIFWPSSMNSRLAEFTQKRRPVGVRGASSNTWPRWPLQRAQRISTRTMPCEVSRRPTMWAVSTGEKKLGQPVPESNLALLSNSGRLHRRQMYVPCFLLSTRLPQNAGSVPLARMTRRSSGVSFLASSSIRSLLRGVMSCAALE
jgi:hypothetical protein